MSGKNIKILLVIFFLLIALLGIKLILPTYQTPKSSYLEKTKGLSKESIQKVEITKISEKVELIKDSGDWKIGGKKADKTKIESLLAYLIPTTAPEEIALTDKRHGELELTDVKSTKINLDTKLTILIGKSEGSSAYVRFDDGPSVYLLSFPPSFSTNPADWFDKTIATIEKTKITKLIFKDKDGSVVLAKKDDKWMVESDSKEIKSEKLDAVFFVLSNFTAQSVYDEKSKTWYPKVTSLVLTVEYDGKSETLELYKGESDYLVKRTSDGERFVTAETSISPLLSAPQDLL